MNKKRSKIIWPQIQKLHIAAKDLGFITNDGDREEYDNILSQFMKSDGTPAKSSKDLNFDQANLIIDKFRKLGWNEKRSGMNLKYEEFKNRDPKFASPKQMRMIDGMWMTSDRVRERTEKAMNNFIKSIVKRSHISMILKVDVKKIKAAIENL